MSTLEQMKREECVVLDINHVESYNFSTKRYEVVERDKTCDNCQTRIKGYCPKMGLAVGSGYKYHCDSSSPKEKVLRKN